MFDSILAQLLQHLLIFLADRVISVIVAELLVCISQLLVLLSCGLEFVHESKKL